MQAFDGFFQKVIEGRANCSITDGPNLSAGVRGYFDKDWKLKKQIS